VSHSLWIVSQSRLLGAAWSKLLLDLFTCRQLTIKAVASVSRLPPPADEDRLTVLFPCRADEEREFAALELFADSLPAVARDRMTFCTHDHALHQTLACLQRTIPG
jgi:hypothetical protein